MGKARENIFYISASKVEEVLTRSNWLRYVFLVFYEIQISATQQDTGNT